MRRAFASFVALALTVSSPTLARAEDQVDLRFQEGLKFADAGQFEEARQAFVQAYALHPTQPTLWNLAMAEMKVGRPAEALRHVRTYRRRSPQDPQYARVAADVVAKLEAQTAQVRVDAPRGAEIVVDGETWADKAPLEDPVAVSPGAHVLEARLGGHSARKNVNVRLGETSTVELTMPPDASPSEPKAPTPRGEPVSPSYVGPIALGAAGLLGLGVGIGFGVSSQSKKSDAESISRPGVCAVATQPDCLAFNDARESANRSGTVSVVAYVTGGALLGGALAWVFIARATSPSNVKEKETALRVLPTFGSTFQGFAAEQRF